MYMCRCVKVKTFFVVVAFSCFVWTTDSSQRPPSEGSSEGRVAERLQGLRLVGVEQEQQGAPGFRRHQGTLTRSAVIYEYRTVRVLFYFMTSL